MWNNNKKKYETSIEPNKRGIVCISVIIKKGIIELFHNPRRSPNDYYMVHPCDYCDTFAEVVIKIPDTNKKICKSCLHLLTKEIDRFLLNIDIKENIKDE